MQLLTKAILAKLPPLYANEDKSLDESDAVVKFFYPDFQWTWYASEGSPVDANGDPHSNAPKVDFIFFGLVDGDVPELGYFALSELQRNRGQWGLPIERDRGFKPTTLQALMDECNQRNRA